MIQFEKLNTNKSTGLFQRGSSSGCDVAFLSHIIHDYSRDKGRSLFKKIYHSLPKGNGAIIISEWLLNDEKTGPVPPALMSLNMMVETSGGRSYSFAEISEMLTEVGFKNIEKSPLGGPAEIMIGYK
jgi:hypothetical protein